MFHLHVSYAAKMSGRTARGCIDYILRLGAFAAKGDRVLYAGSLNMPDWVADGAGISYWQAADGQWTRANGRLLYRVEFALPKQLSLEQQIDASWAYVRFLSSLCARGTSSRGVPASFAIHAGHGRNPHLHCLLSTSLVDAHQRTAGRWFKRHDPKRPETTGAAKAVFMATFKWLRRVRAGWARIGNAALERAGLPRCWTIGRIAAEACQMHPVGTAGTNDLHWPSVRCRPSPNRGLLAGARREPRTPWRVRHSRRSVSRPSRRCGPC